MITIERIFCPTDLTLESDEALRYATALAQAYQAKLFVCHCLDKPIMTVAGNPLTSYQSVFADVILKQLRPARLAELDWEGILVEGEPTEAIAREAANRQADLIVMRSRRRPLSAALIGSTAEAICRTAPCPVLVTHPQEREWVGHSTSEINLRRILVAYDFSDDSELALSYGLSLAQEYQAKLDLLHVLTKQKSEDKENLYNAPPFEQTFQATALRLSSVIPDEVHLWCKVRQLVVEGQPYREILNYADEQKVDLICMGVRGSGFGLRTLFGSNVDRVLRQAPCPVLIARPKKPAT